MRCSGRFELRHSIWLSSRAIREGRLSVCALAITTDLPSDLLLDCPDARAAVRALLAAPAGNGSCRRDLERMSAVREQVDLDDDSPRPSASLDSLKVEIELSSLHARQVEAAVSVYPDVSRGRALSASLGARAYP
jgi:hypothetical protein